jgi:hypothetical protein
MQRPVVIVSAAALAALALAACSSSTSGKPSTSSPKSSTGAASSTSAASGGGGAPTKDKLTSFQLTAADLPSTWKGTAADNSDTSVDQEEVKLASCLGVPDSGSKRDAQVSSDDFALGDATISSQATSISSQAIIDQDAKGITGPKATPCIKQLLADSSSGQLPAGAKIDRVDITVTPGSGGLGSNVIATASGAIVITVSGQQVSAYVNVAFIAGKLVEAEVDAESVGAPIDQTVMSKAVTAVAKRVAAG